MMNILFFVNAFPSPDKPKNAPFNLRAVKNLVEFGVNVSVVHFRSWVPGRKLVTKYYFEDIQIYSVALPYYPNLSKSLLGLNLFAYKHAFSFLFKKYFKQHYDIIHSVGVSHSSVIGSVISKKYNIPHIAQAIGTDANIILPQIIDTFGVRNFNNNVKVFTCNSIELEKQIQSILPGVRTRVIYRGVNSTSFSPDFLRRPSDSINYLYLGGLSPKNTHPFSYNQKGGLTLLRAWKIFKSKTGDTESRLIFAGPNINMDVISAELNLPLSDLNIEIAGQLNKDQVLEKYQSSHVVIIPSMFEGMPNVALESSACGCAIIGTKVGGIPEIIRDGFNGLLVDRNNDNELSGAIIKLNSAKSLIELFGKNARQLVVEKFDYRNFPLQYLELYKEVLKKQ